MIERLDSTLGSFKSLIFTPGLNVIVAEKSPGANERQTRNGVGKSSIVELIHFLLGGSVGPDHFLHAEPLLKSAFSMRFALAGAFVEVERSVENSKDVTIKSGDVVKWCRQPRLNKKTGELVLSNTDWKTVLGDKMFGLPDEDEGQQRYRPSFRSLLSYFVRRQSLGGFHSPQQNFNKQQPWDQQVSITYLLGLDARVPAEIQEVKDREKALKVFKKAAKEGAFGEFLGKAADLRTKLTLQETQISRLREQVRSFKVVPQYAQLEAEASELTGRIALLLNENSSDRALVAQLKQSVNDEAPPRFAEVKRVYEECGIVLPTLVQKRFEDVERFHKSIVENRRSHLRTEIAAAEQRIAERDRQKTGLDERRAQLMGILESGGALEHFSELQSELSRREAQTEALRKQFEAADTLERKRAVLDVERARLHTRLQDDHHEQRDVIRDAIVTFEEISNALYEKAGSLTVNETQSGPSFDVKMVGDRSKGISNMQIFCFDLMLMELATKRGRTPGFLIHDSHLFDGVDPRQCAHAIELGAQRAAELGFQYIVTMNEDQVPRPEFRQGFNFDKYVNAVRLTDATDNGGLFGVRFD